MRTSGVAGFSGGNFALALLGRAAANVLAKVVMSKTADPPRINGQRDLGAEVVFVDGIAAAMPELDRSRPMKVARSCTSMI